MQEANVSTLAEASNSFMERARRERAYPVVTVEKGSIFLFDRSEDGSVQGSYEIELRDLRTPARVAFWVRQIAPKTWVTKRHLELFAQIVFQANGGRD